jgi:methylenetetrahydrofolate dehydrogenase (NADP+)/methenyltetrahydrofolate cyclohydrolase
MAHRVLDGRALARAREPSLTARAERVARRRGRLPTLFLLAFPGSDGRAAHVDAKIRACQRVGVRLRVALAEVDAGPGRGRQMLETGVREDEPDGVFIQFPFPPDVDRDALTAVVPRELDIDVMSRLAYQDYMNGHAAAPPLTVMATLELLEAHRQPIRTRTAVVVGPRTPFNRMFAEALRRRGATTSLVPPESPERCARLGEASLVVVSAAQPAVVSSGELPAGSTVVDAGYFNPGGRGDIATSAGTDHLAALAPVPGGVGPMTISALVEAVIERAERSTRPTVPERELDP